MKGVALLVLLAIAQPGQAKEDPVAVIKRAAAAYREHDHRTAGDLFLRAHELTNVATQLRNAAKAYQDGELWPDALDAWQRYRNAEGIDDSARAEADAQMALISERQALDAARIETDTAKKEAEDARKAQAEAEARATQAEALRAPPPAPPPPMLVQTAPEPPSPVGAYVTIGTGAAALIASGALFLHANGRLSKLDVQLAMTDGMGRITGIDRTSAESELSGINTERNTSAAILGVGVVAVVAGVVWWIQTRDP